MKTANKPTEKQSLVPVVFTLPAYWACYLINGDVSEGREMRREADMFLSKNNLPMPVSCSDNSWFAKSNDAGTLAGDVMEFTFLIEGKRTIASLDSFTRGYIVAAFWTNDDDAPGGCDYRHTSRPDECFAQLSVEALNAMIDDCARFQDFNSALLAMAGTDEQNGIDFWLTRNGHGAGFWDRGYEESVGAALTSACKTFGESNLYTGDDGKLYIA